MNRFFLLLLVFLIAAACGNAAEGRDSPNQQAQQDVVLEVEKEVNETKPVVYRKGRVVVDLSTDWHAPDPEEDEYVQSDNPDADVARIYFTGIRECDWMKPRFPECVDEYLSSFSAENVSQGRHVVSEAGMDVWVYTYTLRGQRIALAVATHEQDSELRQVAFRLSVIPDLWDGGYSDFLDAVRSMRPLS